MSNKIIQEVFKDLKEHSEMPLVSEVQFNNEIKQLQLRFNEHVSKYNELVKNKDPEVFHFNQTVRFLHYLLNHPDTKKDFYPIFNEHRIEFNFVRLVSSISSGEKHETTEEKVLRLFKEKHLVHYEELKTIYKNLVEKKDESVGNWEYTSLHNYLSKHYPSLFANNKYVSKEDVDNIEKLFLYHYAKGLRKVNIEDIIVEFEKEQRKYFKTYWDLATILENYIKHERTGQNSKYIINAGNVSCRGKLGSLDIVANQDKYTIEKNGYTFTYYKKVDPRELNCLLVIIYIITDKSFIKLMVNEAELLGRSEYLIRKDIKKIEINNDHFLKIHFHRYNDSETVIMNDYSEALSLQKYITGLR